jgi:uncharacterized protein YacL
VSAIGAVSIIFGIIVFIFGLILLAWSFSLPVLFAGQYLIFSGLVLVAGIVLCILGYRTGRNKKLEKEHPNSVTCKNCSATNADNSEFCHKCGIRIQ